MYHIVFLHLAIFYLYPAEKYHYLSQSGCFSDPTLDDQQDYLNVIVSNTEFDFVTSFVGIYIIDTLFPTFTETFRSHRLSTYADFSEKLTFLTP